MSAATAAVVSFVESVAGFGALLHDANKQADAKRNKLYCFNIMIKILDKNKFNY